MTNTLPLCNCLVHHHHVRFYSIYSHSWWDYQIGGFWGFCFPHCGRPVQLVLRLWPVLTLSTPRALYIWSRTWKMDEITKSFRNNILFEFHFIASVHPPLSHPPRLGRRSMNIRRPPRAPAKGVFVASFRPFALCLLLLKFLISSRFPLLAKQ